MCKKAGLPLPDVEYFIYLHSVTPISGVAVRGKCNGDVVVLVILYFKYHFDERVERVFVLRVEIRGDVVCQFVDTTVVRSIFFQEIFDSSVCVCHFLVNDFPVHLGLTEIGTGWFLLRIPVDLDLCPECGWRVENFYFVPMRLMRITIPIKFQ